ncbi:hypothetical protein DNTS_026042 [Danionella cerebrum]|uniref:Uncharacterized protein n=1 Tax=Danionella cerebrum TaxID=2873325 RepID=A0A553Q2H9_9TELE|nr:hypothetical protein DNTS_026042 [Danionella translucida]
MMTETLLMLTLRHFKIISMQKSGEPNLSSRVAQGRRVPLLLYEYSNLLSLNKELICRSRVPLRKQCSAPWDAKTRPWAGRPPLCMPQGWTYLHECFLGYRALARSTAAPACQSRLGQQTAQIICMFAGSRRQAWNTTGCDSTARRQRGEEMEGKDKARQGVQGAEGLSHGAAALKRICLQGVIRRRRRINIRIL